MATDFDKPFVEPEAMLTDAQRKSVVTQYITQFSKKQWLIQPLGCVIYGKFECDVEGRGVYYYPDVELRTHPTRQQPCILLRLDTIPETRVWIPLRGLRHIIQALHKAPDHVVGQMENTLIGVCNNLAEFEKCK